MDRTPTPWRASKALNGSWRVIRTTWLGYATRVEVRHEGMVKADAVLAAWAANGRLCTGLLLP